VLTETYVIKWLIANAVYLLIYILLLPEDGYK